MGRAYINGTAYFSSGSSCAIGAGSALASPNGMTFNGASLEVIGELDADTGSIVSLDANSSLSGYGVINADVAAMGGVTAGDLPPGAGGVLAPLVINGRYYSSNTTALTVPINGDSVGGLVVMNTGYFYGSFTIDQMAAPPQNTWIIGIATASAVNCNDFPSGNPAQPFKVNINNVLFMAEHTDNMVELVAPALIQWQKVRVYRDVDLRSLAP